PVTHPAAVPVTITTVAPAGRAAVATVAPAGTAVAATPRSGIPGSRCLQLLDGLTRDIRVARQPQPDPAPLAVDLDHSHGQLVALVEDLLDGCDPLARRDVGDVEQAVGALGELDERSEGGRLDHLAGEFVADLDLLGHRA